MPFIVGANAPAPRRGTSPEWRLFFNMRRSAGGVSLLLLLQSALAFIMILAGTRGENSSKISSDESQTCSRLLAWFIVYASWLLVFRLVHEVSLHMWITGAARGLSWRLHRGIAAQLLLHLVSGPVFVLMISSGAWLIGSNVGKTCLAPNMCFGLSFNFDL